MLFDEKYGIIISAVTACADVAQLVERVLGKDEVTGSIPVISSRSSSPVKSSQGSFFMFQGFARLPQFSPFRTARVALLSCFCSGFAFSANFLL